MKRPMIYCPGPGKWLTLGQYVNVVRMAKANLDREFQQGITCWWPCTGRDVVKQFMDGVHDRINQKTPYIERIGVI